MAIELTEIQRQVVDRLQSEALEQAQQGAASPNDASAARFADLMDAPAGATPEDAASPTAPEPVATRASSPAHLDATATVGDRILANMASNPAQTPPSAPAGTADAVPGGKAVDATDPVDLMGVQAEVVELKTTTALAAGVVHKTTQGVDTLLKAQ